MHDIMVAWESTLRGWPNGVLTAALVVAALVVFLIALRGTATEKVVALAYVTLP